MSVLSFAQNSANSPYTRYGYGALADRSFGAGRAMGGIGYGLRSSQQINPMNPASYSAMDSLTFLLDAGVMFQLSWFDDGQNKQRNMNGNFEYVAMQFPLTRRLAMSVGLLPYSHVGYDFGAYAEDGPGSMVEYSGTGGLTEVYAGLSADIWKKRLAFGANVSYMFGKIDHRRQITTTNVMYTMNKIDVHDVKFDFGMQYTHPLTKTERMTFGVAYSPAVKKLSTTAYDVISFNQYFTSVVKADTFRNTGFSLPASYGFGVTYTKDYKAVLAADVSCQNWSGAQLFGSSDEFKNRIKVALGGEYIPNNFTRVYLNRLRYRAGLHYSNSYLKIKDSGYNELGVSVGAGFPMPDNRSFLNASFEYVKVMPGSKALIHEQYFRFTLSYTFNEYWFFKRKME
ncbi:MAG: hypothetical protein LBP64_02080 [Tannerella sp.]|nr:hypothetical protein [Tannerella sp.]